MSGNIKKIVEPNSGIDYSLEKDFKIFTLSKELPITTYPSYIRLGIVIYCVKGNANLDRRVTSNYNPKGEFTNYFYKIDKGF